MRAWFLGWMLTVMLAFGAVAQDSEIEGVISDQIEAFKIDDFARAFTHASPNIQRIFRTPENFGRMVSQGYPMVWRPTDLTFLGLREENGSLVKRLQVTDGAGRSYVLDYFMIETPQGWKINGVTLLDQGALSA